MQKLKTLSIEQALQLSGNGHSYQTRIILFFFLQTALMSFFNAPFTFESPDCENRLFEYDSFTKEFELYCEKASFIDLIWYIQGLAWGIGFLLFGWFSNVFQRNTLIKKGLLIIAALSSLLAIPLGLFMATLIYSLCNMTISGVLALFLLHISEISSENLKTVGITVILSGFGLGRIIISLLGRIYFNWRYNGLIYIVPLLLILLVYLRILINCPRFLIVKKSFNEARKSLEALALMNNRTFIKGNEYKFDEEVKSQEMQENLSKLLHIPEKALYSMPNNHNYLSLFKYNSLRVRTLIFLYFSLLIGYIAYFSLYHLNYSNIPLVEELIQGLISIFGVFIGGYISLNYQRKVALKGLLFIIGISAVLMGLEMIFSFLLARIILNLLIQIPLNASIPLILCYITEVYPTVVRHYAFGLFLMVFCLGGTLARGLKDLGDIQGPFLGGVCFIGLGVMGKLRETFALGLKENLVEENEALLNNAILGGI